MNNKIIIVLFLLGMIVLAVGCNKDEPASTYSKTSSYSGASSSASYKSNSVSSSDLKISNMNVRSTGKMRYLVGEITNTSSANVDEYADLAMYDGSSVVKVQKIIIKLGPGEKMAFDELIGINGENVTSARIQL